MTRREKNFIEKREELIGTIEVLTHLIQAFEESGRISYLRVVAAQLRALVVLEPKSSNLRHPLLIELAKAAGFPLRVFSGDPNYLDALSGSALGQNLQFFSMGDSLNLEKTAPYLTDLALEEALENVHTLVGGERLSIKEIIRLVADTEGAHFDPTRPGVLDDLDTIHLGGLPTEYRIIYSVSKIIRDLSYRVIQGTI